MSKRRGSGEDSIYRDGDRWRGAISLGYGPNGRRTRKKVSGRTRAEVVGKLRELRQRADAGLPMPDERLTLEAFLTRWLSANLPGHIADSTLDDYADTVRLHLAPALGRKRVSRLTVGEVDALWASKREQGYSANSIRIMRAVLRKALGQAEREGLVIRNVAALSTPPRVSVNEGRSLTVDQSHQLLEAARGHRMEALLVVMLAYGLRRGEALGLHWSSLDWSAMRLRVTHGVKRIKTRDQSSGRRTLVVVGELKTRRSRRVLYLTSELVEMLRRHKARQAEDRVAAGASWQTTI